MVVTANFWAGKRVLVTGHTGFKGAWLCQWLRMLGAEVTGMALPPEPWPSLWAELALGDVTSIIVDICDPAAVTKAVQMARPEIVLHLAAQSLVRRSYREPVETFATNVMGTVHVLNALRSVDGMRAAVAVTSDKCYRNDETAQAFAEGDPLGGRDPYSASKGAAEIAIAAMRDSFFRPGVIASARAGNVIGGGDWAEDRLVPDIFRGCLGGDGKVVIRSPDARRPWQHVLEPLAGYMTLAQALWTDGPAVAPAYNFGPDPDQERPVIELARDIVARLGKGEIVIDPTAADLHEAGVLRLDSARARGLGWRPLLSFSETVEMTADWYGGFAAGRPAAALCRAQIEAYDEKMRGVQ